jgi:hypothetical protein
MDSVGLALKFYSYASFSKTVKVRMNGIILMPKSCFNGEEFYRMERYLGDREA